MTAFRHRWWPPDIWKEHYGTLHSRPCWLATRMGRKPQLTMTASYVHFLDGGFLRQVAPGKQTHFLAAFVTCKFR
jgi:hypothetical protein